MYNCKRKDVLFSHKKILFTGPLRYVAQWYILACARPWVQSSAEKKGRG
jgi:hypothetical protein